MAASQALARAALAFFLAGCAGVAPDCSVEVDYASKYVARGAVLFDGPAVQPALTAVVESGGGTWSGGAWSTIDASDEAGHSGEWTEVDVHVEYERSLGPATLTLGLLRYFYPRTGFPASAEAHAAIACENELATPTLHLWYDYDQADGAYFSFDLARDFDLDERWNLALSASAGWMAHGQGAYYFGVDSGGFSDLTTSAALAFAPSEKVGFTFTLGSSRVLDGDYRDAVDDADSAWVMVGATFGF